jgi:hypothetical protein
MNRLRLSLLIVVILAFFPTSSLASPLDCTGYRETRYFVESQAWWTTLPGQHGTNFGHVHTATCFPLGQRVNGIVPFDIRLILHDNPGKLTNLVIQIGASGSYIAAKHKFDPPLTCASTCEWWVHLDANTTDFSSDGWQEIRIRPTVIEPDGNKLVGSTSYQVYLTNGKPVQGYRPPDFIQGKGWYSSVDYAQAKIISGFPWNRTVSSIWMLNIACDSSSAPVAGCLVTIDPNFHMENEGIVILRKNEPFKGTIIIDTRLLVNGQHRLVIRTDVRAPADSTLSGILNIPFVVQNSMSTGVNSGPSHAQ